MHSQADGLIIPMAIIDEDYLRSMRNGVPTSIEEIRVQMHDVTARVQNLQAAIDAEGRTATAEEARLRDELMAEFDHMENELRARIRLEEQDAKLAASAGRQVSPADGENSGGDGNPASAAPMASHAGEPQRPKTFAADDFKPVNSAVKVVADLSYGRNGFKSFGEFAMSVRMAHPTMGGGRVDPRLASIIKNQQPGSYGSEGVDADGGFAVPPDFREDIVKKLTGEDSIVRYTDQQTTTSKGMSFPIDEEPVWGSGGVQAAWLKEAQKKVESKPLIGMQDIDLNKLAVLVPLSDELIEDAPALTRWLNVKVPEAMGYKINDAIINGTGVDQPTGLLTSPAMVTVPAATGQAAATVLAENIIKMYASMYVAGRSRGVWLVNPAMIEQLMVMTFPGTSGATAVPVYLPAGGLSQSPYGTIMGRPVIETEAVQPIGSVGDIVFADLSQYMTLTRRGGGIKQDISIHIYFDYDVTAFRFVLRFGGKPWWTKPITGGNSGMTYSAFVALAARA